MRRSGNEGRLLSEKGVTGSGYLLSSCSAQPLNEWQRENQQAETVSSLSRAVVGSCRDSEASQSSSLLPDRAWGPVDINEQLGHSAATFKDLTVDHSLVQNEAWLLAQS